MDNVTHAVAGMLLAELVLERRERKSPGASWRAQAYAVSIAANNLPDLDLLLVPLTSGKLGYLLHHRGHTHTVAFVAVAAILFAIALRGWTLRRFGARSKEAWHDLSLLASMGLLLHLVFDFTNSYGVHPFWPLDTGWYFGDALFILEPWLWVLTLPALISLQRGLIPRVVLGLVLMAGVVAAWAAPWVRSQAALALSVGAVAVLVTTFRLAPRARLVFALVGWAGITGLFAWASGAAEAAGRARLAELFPGASVHEVIVTPSPADPVCHQLIAVVTRGDRYEVRVGAASVWPSRVLARDCVGREVSAGARTAPMLDAPLEPTSDVVWSKVFVAPRERFQSLVRENCHAAAFSRFARAPFWMDQSGKMVLGDLRYDHEAGLGFAELEVPSVGSPCPTWVPAWRPPRKDLFSDGASP